VKIRFMASNVVLAGSFPDETGVLAANPLQDFLQGSGHLGEHPLVDEKGSSQISKREVVRYLTCVFHWVTTA